MKGTYVLVVKLKRYSKLKIGKLGYLHFPKGYYCYVGSALGKTINLEKRIKRYEKLNKEKSGKLKWHIDYFLVNPNSLIIDVIKVKAKKRIECMISDKLGRIADNSIPNFGCSDCDCKSHLHYFESKQEWKKLLTKLK
jgi:Uri superfamily endonuclease